MPKPSEQAQINFIADCLRKGEQRKDILEKFGNNWKTVGRSTFDTRLKAAKLIVDAELAAITDKAGQRVEQEVEARKLKILTLAERVDILARMANGELEAEKIVFTKDGAKKIKVKPDHNEIKAAIAELNKMDGSYAASKVDVSGSITSIKVVRE